MKAAGEGSGDAGLAVAQGYPHVGGLQGSTVVGAISTHPHPVTATPHSLSDGGLHGPDEAGLVVGQEACKHRAVGHHLRKSVSFIDQ